jgi:uncharacterized membrane protein YvlD (DUF360 family)
MPDHASPPAPSTAWAQQNPGFRPARLLLGWGTSSLGLLVAAWIVPGVAIEGFWAAVAAAAAIAVLNALIPPLIAALRLPGTLAVGFLLVLVADAIMLQLVAAVSDGAFTVDAFGWALLTAIVASAVTMAIQVVAGVNDDDRWTLHLTRRIARRQGGVHRTDAPGLLCLEIDGLALPVLQRAMRDGNAPNLARWVAEGTHVLNPWEPDTSSQTGASQAGILLGSNEGIPAFRWVEKDTGRVVSCSSPRDCADIEARLASGDGLLVNGGTSRGNLLSGEADEAILTVSRMSAERAPNAGYRAFLADGYNVTRTLSLFVWEVALELVSAARQRRRDVRPRGHRGGSYPFIRGGMCVFVRDLIVHSVLTDMMAGRPIVYATFAGYDEVAHHSGLERHDTLEALRKIDQQFGRIDRARPYAARPYEIVVLSDHGQTQGATFRQRNGHGLDDLVARSMSGDADVQSLQGEDENAMAVGRALDDARGKPADEEGARAVAPREDAVVLASGNLGLVYLMEEDRRMTLEEIEARHPALLPALTGHEHIGFVMVATAADGPVVLGRAGRHRLRDGRVEGDDPLAGFGANAARHLLRTDGFTHCPDILVNSFYDPQLQEGCAFEELISFHGGMGGTQTEPFLLHPAGLPMPPEPVVGAAAVHEVLTGWRRMLQMDHPAAGGRVPA